MGYLISQVYYKLSNIHNLGALASPSVSALGLFKRRQGLLRSQHGDG